MDSLPAGRYEVKPKETTFLQAVCNGHQFVIPGTTAVSDGSWVTFYNGDKMVWDCNSFYAAAHFLFEEVSNG